MNVNRVLYILRPADGGMRKHAGILICGLLKKGIEVHVACPDSNGMHTEFSQMGAVMHSICLSGPIRPKTDLICIQQLRSIMKKTSFDIIHCHGAKAGLIGRVATSLENQNHVIYTAHNFILYDEVALWRRFLFHFGEHYLGRKTTQIITVSKALENEMVSRFGLPRNKVKCIYNGIDFQRFQSKPNKWECREHNGWPQNTFIIGTLARMAPQKGLHYLIQAIPSILKNCKVKVIIGGDGPLMKELIDLTKSLNVEEHTIFPGYIKDVPSFLGGLDVFVIPSIAEGLSITTIEAMATGLPVVATNTGGLPELILDGQNGILIPARDPEALAKALTGFINNPQKIVEMGLAAQKFASQNFSLDQMVEKTINLYDQICGKALRENIQ